jgi:hypothetical protein
MAQRNSAVGPRTSISEPVHAATLPPLGLLLKLGTGPRKLLPLIGPREVGDVEAPDARTRTVVRRAVMALFPAVDGRAPGGKGTNLPNRPGRRRLHSSWRPGGCRAVWQRADVRRHRGPCPGRSPRCHLAAALDLRAARPAPAAARGRIRPAPRPPGRARNHHPKTRLERQVQDRVAEP